MQMLQQVVDTSENTFRDPSQTHLVMPAVSDRLQCNRIDVIWHES